MNDRTKLAVSIIQDPVSGRVLLQHRDDNAKNSPNKWGLFGGGVEAGETPEVALKRELEEEIGISIDTGEAKLIAEYEAEPNFYRYVFLVTSIPESAKIVLGEGQGYEWISSEKIFGYDLTWMTEKDLNSFLNKH